MPGRTRPSLAVVSRRYSTKSDDDDVYYSTKSDDDDVYYLYYVGPGYNRQCVGDRRTRSQARDRGR